MGEDLAAVFGSHSFAEAVLLFALALFGLVGANHKPIILSDVLLNSGVKPQ